jgi:hypothetical protein
MKISGNTQIDLSLSKLDISNIDYEINLNTNSKTDENNIDFGIVSKKNKNKSENGIGMESNMGPMTFKINLVTDQNKIPEEIDDLNINLLACYNYDKNFNFGLKYETDANQEKYEILSGVMNSNVDLDSLKLKLSTENIIYGYENRNDVKVNLFGNKINPSLNINENLGLGLLYHQIEEIDEYGNKEDSTNRLCLDLKFDI